MINLMKVTGILILGLSAALLFREKSRMLSFFCAACAFLTVIISTASGEMAKIISEIMTVSENTLPDTVKIMVKALGISYIAAIVSEICSASGENMLSEAAAFTGKAEIMLLALPLLWEILGIAGDVL